MIPISLTLQGIYSYKENTQIIDFTNLCNAGLFGIFGKVGSGKSTILEAISYALYGETERLHKREKRSYNMMNLKSNNLLIDFIFRSIRNDKEYRFVVKGRRNTKQFDDVKSHKRFAYVKEKNEWISLKSTDAENIIGLNYTNFRRTIIIPQGKFQEFLQLSDSERTIMMKELFQLHKFDFSDKIKKIEQENNTKQIHIDGQLQQLEHVSLDKITAINEELLNINADLQKNSSTKKILQQKENELSKLKYLFDKIAIARKEYIILKEQQPKIEKLKIKQKDYEYCSINFKSRIDKLKSDLIKLHELEKVLAKNKKRHDELQLQLQKSNEKFDIVKPKYALKDELKQEVDDCNKVLKIKQLYSEIKYLENRKLKGQKIINQTIDEINRFTNEQVELKQSIKSIKDNEIDISLLYRVKEWFRDLQNIKNNKILKEKEIKSKTDEKNGILAEIKEILISSKINFDAIDNKDISNKFENKLLEYEIKENELTEEKENLQLKKELASYAEKLKEGKECPVCGAIHHPKKLQAKDLTWHLENISNKLQIIKYQAKDMKERQQKVNIQFSNYENISKSLIEIKTENNKLNVELEIHKNNYNFSKKFSEEELNLEFEKADKQKQNLKELENKLYENEKLLNEKEKNKNKYQIANARIDKEIDAKKVEAATIRKQIKSENIENIINTDAEELSKKIEEKNKEYKSIVEEYENTRNQIDKLSPEIAKLKGIVETKTNDFTNLSADYESGRNNLNNDIQLSKYESIIQIEQIIQEAPDIEKGNKKISEFEKNYFNIKSTIKELEKSVEGNRFEKEEFYNLQLSLKKIQENIDKQNKKIGFLQQEKTNTEGKWKNKTALQTKKEKLELRNNNIQVLKNLFKGNGFVNYISKVYLQNLVNAANKRFSELTQQKLRLELNENNDFEVRDYLNGGEKRSIKTLSGGQTFQASLSLALALTDNIQQKNSNNNNFFLLDEGFGSLDTDSLSDVFKSLKSLRKENRIVGIISHVEVLQQEIDSYLLIKNNDTHGSVVHKSWESLSNLRTTHNRNGL